MRINKKNLSDIDKTINGIIMDWADTVEIWNIRPIEEQPNWNKFMREIDGEIMYDKLIDVPVQLTDMSPVELQTSVAGDKFIGEMVLYIPLEYEYNNEIIPISINEDSLFILHGDTDNPWRVKTMKRLPGERIVRVIHKVGD